MFFGRDSQVQKLLEKIQENLRLLEQKEIYVIGDKLDELQQATEALKHDGRREYMHTGAGNIFANEGGSPRIMRLLEVKASRLTLETTTRVVRVCS